MLPQSSTAACHTSLGIFSGLDAELAGSTAAVAEGPVSICVNIGAWSDYVASGAVMTQAACGSYSAYGLSRWVVSEPLSSCSAACQIVRLSCSSSGLQTANQFVDSTSKMQTITSQLGYHCNGQADNTVNKGSGVSCSGDVASCDSSTCCEAPATCATTPSDCNGQADNTVNKGPDASCSGDAASCDSSTSCEAPTTCATTPFDCTGEATNPVHNGSSVSYRMWCCLSPKLWMGKLCIDQCDINKDLQCFPIFWAGSDRLLIFRGLTYTSRMWCCLEL